MSSNQIDVLIKQKIVNVIDNLDSTKNKVDAQNIYLLTKDVYALAQINTKPVSDALNYIVAYEKLKGIEIE